MEPNVNCWNVYFHCELSIKWKIKDTMENKRLFTATVTTNRLDIAEIVVVSAIHHTALVTWAVIGKSTLKG